MKSALFVDFDNIYSGLRHLSHVAADQFACSPVEWVNWLTKCVPLPEPVPDGLSRRILVRRCYLNPQVYQRFRSCFSLAGFDVVDCPALTSGGKTCTDMHMVLDIVELLQNDTAYDEFIILSADADFTPILRKLRRSDRRTTMLGVGFPSAAYRASADLVIDQNKFIEIALGVTKTATDIEKITNETEIKRDVAQVVSSMVSGGPGATPLSKVGAYLTTNVKGVEADTWCGFGSLTDLLRACDLGSLRISAEGDGMIVDPSRSPKVVKAIQVEAKNENQKYVNRIFELVAQSSAPLACANVAGFFRQDFNPTPNWFGHGSFKRFLNTLDLGELVVEWNSEGGFIRDPSRKAKSA